MPSDDDGDGNAGNNVPNRRAIVHAPDKFTWDNPAAWPDFIENFSRFLRISGYKDDKDEEKIDILLYYLGIKAITIYRTFVFDANVRNYNNVVKKFSDYFQPRKNVIYHRAIFNRRNQMENEAAEHYIRELLTLAESCDYGEMKDQLIRDRLVVGILDKQLSEELQLDNDLTQQSAMDKIRAREQIKRKTTKEGKGQRAILTITTELEPLHHYYLVPKFGFLIWEGEAASNSQFLEPPDPTWWIPTRGW